MSDDLTSVPDEPATPENESNTTPPDLLWIREGSDFVVTSIYLYHDPLTRRLKSLFVEPSSFAREQGLLEYPVETRWSVPTRGQLDGYRNTASRYNAAARAVLTQRTVLEDLIIKNHLQEILLGPEGQQTRVELVRDSRGKLAEDSVAVINQLHPSVTDLLLAKFVDDAALIL